MNHKFELNGIFTNFCVICGSNNRYTKCMGKDSNIPHKFKYDNNYGYTYCLKCGFYEKFDLWSTYRIEGNKLFIIYTEHIINGNKQLIKSGVSSPEEKKYLEISCTLTDDEYDVKDIIE
jgi:hypothetical protein